MKTVSRLSRCLLLLVLCGVFPCEVGAEGDSDARSQVIFALSGRHLNISLEALEQMAHGEDELVKILLEARRMDSPPALGVRAEKLLINYASRSDVQEALAADIDSERYVGLARVLTAHLDSVPDEALRRKLARQALDRASREKSFLPYAKSLLESRDEELRELARMKLGSASQ